MSQTKAQLINPLGTVSNLNVTGVSTVGVVTGATSIQATVFYGSGAGLTGVASTDNIQTATPANFLNNVTIGGNLTVNGTQTIINTQVLDVADKTIGIGSTSAPSDSLADGSGIIIYGTTNKTLLYDNGNSRLAFSTNVYAPKYYGDGSQLSGVVSGVELKQAGSTVGTSITTVNFQSGATLTAGSGIGTITLTGISTTAYSPAANAVITLGLSTAQHHELTLTAGITTITCSGGSFGDSHSVVLIQPSSGIATVGFSTFFLFPSGSSPVMSQGSGKIDLISFVVRRAGSTGISTQLLASAGLDYQ